MVKTKGLAQTQANWDGAIGQAASKYKVGVEAADNVIEKAIAAEDNYAAGVSEAVANRTRVKGLQKTSTAEWKAAASTKGAQRIGPGMTAAKAKFGAGMGEVLSTIESVQIAARTQDPMANIDNRVKPIAAALYAMKRR